MKFLGVVLPYFSLLVAIALASPGDEISYNFSVDKYTSSFLGGALINVNQAQEAPELPAISTVSGEWNVPWMRAPPGADPSNVDNHHKMAQWTGILGNACDDKAWSPFLQAGTATETDSNGTTTAFAWVEWFPASSHNIPSDVFLVSPGDRMRVVTDVYTRTTGHVYMKNLRTSQEYEEDVTADSPRDPKFLICLGYGTAQFFQEWVIGDDRSELPVFNNVTFTNVETRDRRGTRFDLGTGSHDYWNMTDGDRAVAIPVEVASNVFVIYSPEGSVWEPAEGDELYVTG
ncbi:concanavalin A-like lectin/glucanase [Hypoxylon sp. FL1284]|nr:concanavalin A-like lectin/glucanase [Hypoxylon sp. FL1284]